MLCESDVPVTQFRSSCDVSRGAVQVGVYNSIAYSHVPYLGFLCRAGVCSLIQSTPVAMTSLLLHGLPSQMVCVQFFRNVSCTLTAGLHLTALRIFLCCQSPDDVSFRTFTLLFQCFKPQPLAPRRLQTLYAPCQFYL